MALVRVNYIGPHPLSLAVHEEVRTPGAPTAFRQSTKHPVVVLHPGMDNEVDEEFIDLWLVQNAESHLVKEGTVSKWQPQPK